MTTSISALTGGPDGVFGRVAEMIQAQHRRALAEQAELVWHLASEDAVIEPAGPQVPDRSRSAA